MKTRTRRAPEKWDLSLFSRSPDETRRLAGKIASRMRGSDILCLYGPLGCGKTTFVQGLATGIGCKQAPSSPSFTLIKVHHARNLTLYHIDLFRVTSSEIPNVGLEDCFSDPKGVCAVEWPESASDLLPSDRLEIFFDFGKRDERILEFKATGKRSKRLMKIRYIRKICRCSD